MRETLRKEANEIFKLLSSSSFIKRGILPFLKLPTGILLLFDPTNETIIEIKESELQKHGDLLLKLTWFSRPGSRIKREILDVIEITTWDCNLRCKYCFVEGGERCKAYLSKAHVDAFLKTFLEDNDKIRKVRLLFTGGEATLNPSIIKYTIEKIKQYKLENSFFVATNGVIPSETLQYLLKENFIFSISLDGSREIHDKLRPTVGGQGSFEYVMKTINILRKNDSVFRIRCTITHESADQMEKLVMFFNELGPEAITFEPVDIIGRAMREYPFALEIKKYVKNYIKALLVALEQNVKVLNPITSGFLEPTIDPCPNFLLQKITLLPTGHISLCNAVTDPSHPFAWLIIGEYDNKEKKFVLSEYALNLLEEIYMRKMFFESSCVKCPISIYCGGGCPYRHMCYSKTKNICSKDRSVCELNQKLLAGTLITWWWFNKHLS